MENQIAIAMPMYNESDGILQTLNQINAAFKMTEKTVKLFIQDDCSTDDSFEKVLNIGQLSNLTIHLEKNEQNAGHGPTTLRAYVRASDSDCDLIMQLDSDGQFLASELPDIAHLCTDTEPIVIGVRKNRIDPWYRKILTLILRKFLQFALRCKSNDPNSPVRVYKNNTLKVLLSKLPEKALIPNIYLTIVASDFYIPVKQQNVSHTHRAGINSQGTMWQTDHQIRIAIPRRLILFSFQAFLELMQFIKYRESR